MQYYTELVQFTYRSFVLGLARGDASVERWHAAGSTALLNERARGRRPKRGKSSRSAPPAWTVHPGPFSQQMTFPNCYDIFPTIFRILL